ncbi:MAG: hypothetical protein ACE5ER_01935 [Nitrospinaceae bacterium]
MPSRVIHLKCSRCDAALADYAKEGSGKLVRVYLDRILAASQKMPALKSGDKAELPAWTCGACGQVLGTPMRHRDGRRLAYRLTPGAVHKRAQ